MARLKVRQIAQQQGLNLSQLQKKAGVTMPSVRRYWYNTRDGKSIGEPLKELDLSVLSALAAALGVEANQLIENGEEAK